jgi:hypothetical protein
MTGDNATLRMAETIYAQLAQNLTLPADPHADAVRAAWRQLAHAVATGVITHIQSHLEPWDPDSKAAPEVAVTGTTAAEDGHTHRSGDLTAALQGVGFRFRPDP